MIELEVLRHDGPARLGRLEIGGASIPTPAACFFRGVEDGNRVFVVGGSSKATIAVPPMEGVARQSSREALQPLQRSREVMIRNPKLGEKPPVPLGTPLVLRAGQGIDGRAIEGARLIVAEGGGRDSRHMIDWVIELRRNLSPNAALLLPEAEVWSFPLYALAGVDLFMDSQAWGEALSGNMIFESFKIPWEPDQEARCPCPFCSRQGRGRSSLLSHNRWITGKVLSEIRTRIRIGEIKHLAEESVLAHPELAATLKHLYREHVDYLEEYTTINPGVAP